MPDEKRQFRALYRDFLSRIVDLEVLSAGGDVQNLLGQFAALLAAFSFTYTIFRMPGFAFADLSPDKLLIVAWGDQEFLLSTTLAIAGLFAVLAWNTVLPDRRESFILSLLPVRVRTIFMAKFAAIGTALGVSVFAVNAFTGLVFPFILTPPDSGAFGTVRSFAAYWITVAAAGIFVFAALLAVQGLAAQLLPGRLFLQVSSFLQLAAFFLILGVYFLTPPMASLRGLTAPENQLAIRLIPSFWFLGLFQELNGSTHPLFAPLALQALWAMLSAGTLAFVLFALSYRRHMRRVIEQPDIAPADRTRPASRLAAALVPKLLKRPLDRAILLFTARTIARSRQHRLLMAAFGGIGLAISLGYARSFVHGYAKQRWFEPNVPFMAGSLILLFFLVVGARAIFALPATLPANWLFRLTAVHSPAAYFAAVRRTLIALAAVPLWIASALFYFSVWPLVPSLLHMAMLIVIGLLLVYQSMRFFRKLPFACSYLPGKANLKVKLGAYGIFFLFAADVGVRIEAWSMERPTRYAVLFGLLLAWLLWARRQTLQSASAEYSRIQWEDKPPAEVHPLDLRRDGAWADEGAYIDTAGLRQT